MMRSLPWKQAWRAKVVWFSLLVMLALGLTAALAPRLAPHDPYRMAVTHLNLPPMWVHDRTPPGLAEHPLGTDRYGRDVLSRMLFGARTAFFLALAAVPLAALVGALLGLLAGYFGGRIDGVILFVTEMIQSLPGIMFMVIIVLILRNRLSPTWLHGLITLIVGFAAVSWVSLAQWVRISVMQLKAQLFVEAAVSVGASSRRIIFRHLLPNVAHVILVWIINNIPAVILLEAVLGYIGVGVTGAVDGGEFTVVSWGGMFFAGRTALARNPLMLAIPALCILLISVSFILLGDFLTGMTRQGEA